jgi:hypothetical protein
MSGLASIAELSLILSESEILKAAGCRLFEIYTIIIMADSEDSLGEDVQEAAREYQPEVLPSLLVDVTPNVFDIEGDTLLPYFIRMKEEHEKRRADKIAKFQQKQMQLAEKIGLNMDGNK